MGGRWNQRDMEKHRAYIRAWRKRNRKRINEGIAKAKAHNPALYAAYNTAWFKAKGPEYNAYRSAKQRCTNPNNPKWFDYGGRGIKFLFTNFSQFFIEIGRRPKGKVLDRRDNNGNYEQGNIRWVSISTSLKNRRRKP